MLQIHTTQCDKHTSWLALSRLKLGAFVSDQVLSELFHTLSDRMERLLRPNKHTAAENGFKNAPKLLRSY